ncbi:hypothetical protein J7M02_00035 [Candidatus Aerophobetes bacterium]|nr:hypothetical protein [Candidatus Aerophobetes bacterium]
MKLKVKVHSKTFEHKYQSVFSDISIKNICSNVGRKKLLEAREKATNLAKQAEQDIRSKYDAPEPGVWGPRVDNPNTMNVSDAIRTEYVITSEESKKTVFKFGNPSTLTQKTDIGGKLEGIGAWELWETGREYWSPQKGKVWVFRKGTKGKYGLGAMILVDKKVADRFLQPVRRFRAPIFKTVRNDLKRKQGQIFREVKKGLKKSWDKYG